MIGVVGGGLAGLTAAYELQSSGHSVRVFESSPRVGGALSRIDPRATAPCRPHTIAPDDDAARSLARSLGVEAALPHGRVRTGYYVDGIAHPTDRLRELLAFPSLSLRDRSHLRSLSGGGRGPFTVPRDAVADPTTLTDVTARSFVTDHATDSLYDHAIEPLLRARFGDAADRISAAWLLAELSRRRSLGDGTALSAVPLVDALVESIGQENLWTDTRVLPLGTRAGAVDHIAAVEDGTRTEQEVDAVVLATSPWALDRLTRFDWPGERVPQTTVCFALDESLLAIDRLTVVDDAPFGRLAAVPASGGAAEIEQFLYAIAPSERPVREDTVAAFRRGIESLFPDFDPESVRWSAVDNRVEPLPTVGYADHVVSYERPSVVAEGCFYAGSASPERYPHQSLDGVVRAGRKAARAASERLESAVQSSDSA
ncbi:FAD-dependent oxidoreductase [Natronoarchaeum sp. GCM10025321]|uniref:FAD-dependent oxidoreductase n=1 Tax=Natronoarchaeum sp. GCM10025321 TaxID=3252684 RepID=UPI00360D3279